MFQLAINSVNQDVVGKFDWYIIPVMNPDGYEYSRTKVGYHFHTVWLKPGCCLYVLLCCPGHNSNSISAGENMSGVIFDRKLSFVSHLKSVKKKDLKYLNTLNVIGNTEWGADRKVMLLLYRSLVRSKLDYGCIVYGSALKSYS